MSSWGVVVPSNRPDRLAGFVEAWWPLFEKHNVHLFVVHDAPSIYSALKVPFRVSQDSWLSVPEFIPRNTDMIRSWGIYRSWKAGTTFTLSLDDDVLPEGDIFDEYEQVFVRGAPFSDYLDVGALTSFEGQLRGFPFGDRDKSEVAIQYGGWSGVLDFDAPTQLAGVPRESQEFFKVVLPIPRGAAVTGCIMNVAWRTEYAPIMWQLPLLEGRFNRFGDIWSGLFQKRVLDALGKVMVVNGRACVRHDRASDPVANLAREAPGIPVNEEMWGWVNLRALPDDMSMLGVYEYLTGYASGKISEFDPGYQKHFIKCRNKWLSLFRSSSS